MRNLLMIAVLATGLTASANDHRIELGIGAGTTHAIAPDDFKNPAKTGDAVQYWLGYGFNQNWGIELGYDVFDFDGIDTKHEQIALSGVYRFIPTSFIHPLAKLGLTSHKAKFMAGGDDSTSLGAKAALGLEADFKYVSVGALFNYVYAQKIQPPVGNEVKDAQALIPALFLTIHNALDTGDGDDKKSESVAPVAAAPVVAAPADTDADGVIDADDKCPNTAAGTQVNAYGCALTETAHVKLNVEFATGKAVLDSKYDSEIESLAEFMKKHTDTSVEIAGHSDNTGSAAGNKVLSQKRATAVKDALVKAGVDAKRLTAKGYGPSQPIADNKTVEGRQANRRVMAEISVKTDKKK